MVAYWALAGIALLILVYFSSYFAIRSAYKTSSGFLVFDRGWKDRTAYMAYRPAIKLDEWLTGVGVFDSSGVIDSAAEGE